MPRLLTGSIHYQVPPSISSEALNKMECEFNVELNDDVRASLKQIAFGHDERVATIRPRLRGVILVITGVIRFVNRSDVDGLANRLSAMAALREHESPEEEYVYEYLCHEMRLILPTSWREHIRSDVELRDVGNHMKKLRARLIKHGKTVRGGSRQHEFGYLLVPLADVCKAIGKRITASSHQNWDGRWVEFTAFARFAKAFIDQLPRPEGVHKVDVGRLIHRARRIFD